MKKIKKYLQDLKLAFEGLILSLHDRALQKEIGLDYNDELKNQIAKYKYLTGDRIRAKEAITLDALRAYTQMKALGMSDDDITNMIMNYMKNGDNYDK